MGWPQCLDMVHLRVSGLEDSCEQQAQALSAQDKSMQETIHVVNDLLADVRRLASDPSAPSELKKKAQSILKNAEDANRQLSDCRESVMQKNLQENNNARLPPSM